MYIKIFLSYDMGYLTGLLNLFIKMSLLFNHTIIKIDTYRKLIKEKKKLLYKTSILEILSIKNT